MQSVYLFVQLSGTQIRLTRVNFSRIPKKNKMLWLDNLYTHYLKWMASDVVARV